MTHEQILSKAVKEAIAAGWTINGRTDGDDFTWEIEAGEFEGDYPCLKYGGMGEIFYMDIGSIMLDHDFAKALWGENMGQITYDLSDGGKAHQPIENWKYRLQQMVIADDPIEYLWGSIYENTD